MTYYIETGNYPKEVVGIEADTKNLDGKGKAEIAVKMQNLMDAFNALGICKFAQSTTFACQYGPLGRMLPGMAL